MKREEVLWVNPAGTWGANCHADRNKKCFMMSRWNTPCFRFCPSPPVLQLGTTGAISFALSFQAFMMKFLRPSPGWTAPHLTAFPHRCAPFVPPWSVCIMCYEPKAPPTNQTFWNCWRRGVQTFPLLKLCLEQMRRTYDPYRKWQELRNPD